MMLSSVDLGLPPWVVVAFLTSGISLSNFALSGNGGRLSSNLSPIVQILMFRLQTGLYCTHQDISREYASILLVRHATYNRFLDFFCVCRVKNGMVKRKQNSILSFPLCLDQIFGCNSVCYYIRPRTGIRN